MVQAVIGGVAEFNALAYGQVNPLTTQFLEQRLMQQVQTFGSTIGDFGRQFYDRAQQAYNQFHGSEAMRNARAAVRKAGMYLQRNEIRPLNNLAELQTAPEAMLRFLMAEPEYRKQYEAQRVDGYSDRYVDMNPVGDIGRDHYEYRRVTEGVLMPDDDDDFKVSFYFDDMRPGDVELNSDQKVDTLSAWDLMKAYRAVGKDDTGSTYGDKR